MIWYGDPESTGRVTLGIPAGLLSRQLPATGRPSTRERDPGNKLVRRMSGAEPAEDPESKVGCDFCHKQEDIQKVSSVDQQKCLCKGKFDTEYVLFTPHELPVK